MSVKVNYALRPAKAIERKMMCEAFRRLNSLSAIDKYRYIGFGSTFFRDFSLFHKTLGIDNMISIEKNQTAKQRFEFNKPFQCIEMKFGQSWDVLSKLPWSDIPTILWCDYESALTANVIKDIDYACAQLAPNSIFTVTVQCNQRGSKLGDLRESLVDLRENLQDKIRAEVKPKDLLEWGKGKLFHEIITAEIHKTLSTRNQILPEGSKYKFRQLFNFHYEDNAKMLTVGGLLYQESREHNVNGCGFESLTYLRDGVDPYLIDIPIFSPRELRHLDSIFPKGERELDWLPKVDIDKYFEIYRYFPNYVETEY